MKPGPHINQADNFLREALKGFQAHVSPPEWDELERVIGREQKKFNTPDPKYILRGAGGLVLVIGVVLLVRFIASRQNTSESMQPSSDTTTLLHAADTVVQPPVVITFPPEKMPAADTLKIESVPLADTISKIAAAPKKVPEEKMIVKEPSAEQKLPPKEPKKKKSKLDALAPSISDTGYVPENILPPDTAGNSRIVNEVIPPVHTPADTAKPAPAKKPGKSKKGKPKGASPDPIPAKPDSLKQ